MKIFEVERKKFERIWRKEKKNERYKGKLRKERRGNV